MRADHVVWTLDARQAFSTPIPAAADPAASRWYLARTDLRSLSTAVLDIEATDDGLFPPSVAAGPDAAQALILLSPPRSGRTALRLADFTRGAITDVELQPGWAWKAGYQMHAAPDEPAVYIAMGDSVGRVDLATGAASVLPVPVGPDGAPMMSIGFPAAPWLAIDTGDRLVRVDRRTLAVVDEVPWATSIAEPATPP